MDDLIIRMEGIDKQFPNVKAVDGGRFELRKGEIHSLIGENGAGKSTIMKILYGLYQPEAGVIWIRGKKMGSYTPNDAIRMGIGMVHQEFMLVKEMSVLENIILGFEPRKALDQIDFDEARKIVDTYVKDYNMEIRPDKKVQNISVGEAQRVEIIKTLYRKSEVLILDEPTAVLTPQEADKLFEILRLIKSQGKSIVFISHKLNEVLEISDRITVMRRGKYIATVNASETDAKQLANMMVGRDVLLDIERNPAQPGDVILEVKDLYASGENEMSHLRGLNFSLRQGEVLGVAGVDGNGQSEVVEVLTGLRKIERGDVLLSGQSIRKLKPKDIRRKGLGHIPEDRNKRGLNKEFSIRDNLIAAKISDAPFSRGIVLQNGEINKFADGLIEKFDVRPPKKEILVGNLSGGNAQKVIVAREVDASGTILIAAQPTRGVDIGSIESIREIINDIKLQGVGVLLVSADLDEIMSLSDRIIVMYEGQITGELSIEDATVERLGLLMTGGNKVNEG